jgi:hypothetical protein
VDVFAPSLPPSLPPLTPQPTSSLFRSPFKNASFHIFQVRFLVSNASKINVTVLAKRVVS